MPLGSERTCEIIRGLMPAQKPKGSVPTLIGFESACGKRRYVFTDVPVDDFRAMWDAYKAEGGDDPEQFVACLFDQKPSPRIIKAVDLVEL